MRVESRYIVFWPSEDCAAIERVGGKAVGLAKLAACGAPVPSGFCITTDAYRDFITANDLEALVLEVQARPENAAAAAPRLYDACLRGTMPEAVAAAILAAYRDQAGDACVAVRSSATTEDLSSASFAGGQATLLDVRGEAELLRAVQRCWASLWNDRVVAYRARMHAGGSAPAIAVVVQQMVRARAAGVLFTCDPIAGRRETLVLEACRGLGESLVSGQVTPEHWELERDTLVTRLHRNAVQDSMLVCNGAGSKVVPVPRRERARSILAANDIRRLARLGLELEAAFGEPLDIEWAIDSTLHILQARPVTAVAAAPVERWESPVPGADWVRRSGGIVEYLAAPPSPLYATAQLPELCRRLGAQFAAMSAPPRQPAYTLLNGYFYLRADYELGPHLLLLPFRYWRAARRGVRRWRRDVLPAQQAGYDSLAGFDTVAATTAALLDHVEMLTRCNADAWDEAVRASRTYVLTEPLFRLVHRWCGTAAQDPVVFLRGFPSQTLAAERAVHALVCEALDSEPLRRLLAAEPDAATLEQLASECGPWLEKLHVYCAAYGHASTSHDYLVPTAADSPIEALRAIRLRLSLPAGDPGARHTAIQRQREEATAGAIRRLASDPVRRRIFTWTLAWAQEGAAAREDLFFYAFRGRPLVRRALLELGKRLVQSGHIALAEDVFFLEWTELQAAARRPTEALHDLVTARRALHAQRCAMTPPPRVSSRARRSPLRRLATALKRIVVGRAQPVADNVLLGAPVSPGVVTGPARIVHSTQDLERLQSGDILVARTATPDWTPSFSVVAGLITDAGGPLSHSSIIAREYGLPSVMGVQRATLAIAEGQMITLDGARGLIQLH